MRKTLGVAGFGIEDCVGTYQVVWIDPQVGMQVME
jgi:hypothetical protein